MERAVKVTTVKSQNERLGTYWLIRFDKRIVARLPLDQDPEKEIKRLQRKTTRIGSEPVAGNDDLVETKPKRGKKK